MESRFWSQMVRLVMDDVVVPATDEATGWNPAHV